MRGPWARPALLPPRPPHHVAPRRPRARHAHLQTLKHFQDGLSDPDSGLSFCMGLHTDLMQRMRRAHADMAPAPTSVSDAGGAFVRTSGAGDSTMFVQVRRGPAPARPCRLRAAHSSGLHAARAAQAARADRPPARGADCPLKPPPRASQPAV